MIGVYFWGRVSTGVKLFRILPGWTECLGVQLRASGVDIGRFNIIRESVHCGSVRRSIPNDG